MKNEMRKSKSTMAHSFSAWIYWNFLSNAEKVTSWINVLPQTLQCSYHNGPCFVAEIMCDMFTKLVIKVTHDLSISLRSDISTADDVNEVGNTMLASDILHRIDAEMSDIQKFLGWAIHELITDTRTAAQEEKIQGDINDNDTLTEKDYCYQIAKSMRILHHDAIQDSDYLMNYYPVFVASYNKGGLCLVAKHMIPFGKHLLQNICSLVTRDKLTRGDCNLIKQAHDILVHDNESFQLFLNCVAGGNCQYTISNKEAKTMWKKLITKTFHARVGVITKRFAEHTTGQFAAKAKTEPLRLELKIKTRNAAIATIFKLQATGT